MVDEVGDVRIDRGGPRRGLHFDVRGQEHHAWIQSCQRMLPPDPSTVQVRVGNECGKADRSTLLEDKFRR